MIRIKDERIRIKDIDKIKEGEYTYIPLHFNQTVLLSTSPSIYNNGKAYIDYLMIENGVVKVKYLEKTSKKLKVKVKGKSEYTYNIESETEYVLPLSEGNGSYIVTIYENVTGSKYKSVITQSLDVIIKNPIYAFLHENIYVRYKSNDKTFNKAKTLIDNKKTDIDKINAIYSWVIKNFSYDKQLAKTVKSGYVPNLSEFIDKKSGICFDYATLTVAMLRCANIPAKLVFGYAGNSYHAWIEVYTKSDGYVNNVFQVKANSWNRLDPTFDSNGKGSASINRYIGDGKNYLPKYYY